MKRLLNEKFLYNGNSYFIEDTFPYSNFVLCGSCPLIHKGNDGYFEDCISTNTLTCYACYKIVKND